MTPAMSCYMFSFDLADDPCDVLLFLFDLAEDPCNVLLHVLF